MCYGARNDIFFKTLRKPQSTRVVAAQYLQGSFPLGLVEP